MNDTILGLISALVIYGLATLALPRTGIDSDDDPSIQTENSLGAEAPREPDGDAPRSG
jgi:hypothetical protein